MRALANARRERPSKQWTREYAGEPRSVGGFIGVPESEDVMDATQFEVRELLERWSEFIRARDIDRLMTLYAPDVVYFDVVPPLQYVGSAAVRRNFLRWFDGWASAIGQEIGDLHLVANGDVAVAYMLLRASGTLKNGRDVNYWVRATVGCHRVGSEWVITHEHVSLPVDVASGQAVMDLVP
jgi:ketosteroid isomerase-like protein